MHQAFEYMSIWPRASHTLISDEAATALGLQVAKLGDQIIEWMTHAAAAATQAIKQWEQQNFAGVGNNACPVLPVLKLWGLLPENWCRHEAERDGHEFVALAKHPSLRPNKQYAARCLHMVVLPRKHPPAYCV